MTELMLPEFPDWMRDARCAEFSPEDFYPSTGQNPNHALAICAGCDVRAKCLQWALDFEAENPGSRYGVFGGTTPLQRRAIARGAA